MFVVSPDAVSRSSASGPGNHPGLDSVLGRVAC